MGRKRGRIRQVPPEGLGRRSDGDPDVEKVLVGLKQELAEGLDALLEEGITLSELAAAAGVSKSNMSTATSKDPREVSLDWFVRTYAGLGYAVRLKLVRIKNSSGKL